VVGTCTILILLGESISSLSITIIAIPVLLLLEQKVVFSCFFPTTTLLPLLVPDASDDKEGDGNLGPLITKAFEVETPVLRRSNEN